MTATVGEEGWFDRNRTHQGLERRNRANNKNFENVRRFANTRVILWLGDGDGVFSVVFLAVANVWVTTNDEV